MGKYREYSYLRAFPLFVVPLPSPFSVVPFPFSPSVVPYPFSLLVVAFLLPPVVPFPSNPAVFVPLSLGYSNRNAYKKHL